MYLNVSETACLKLDAIFLPPLLFGGNHIPVIFAPNMHQKLFFRAPKANFYLPWEGRHPLRPPPPPHPLGRFAPSQITLGEMEI